MAETETKKMTRKEKKELKQRLKRLKSGNLEKRDARVGLVFMIPWFIGAAVCLAYPLITSFWYALNNIRNTTLGQIFTFVRLSNFTQILIQDPDFLVQLVDQEVNDHFGAHHRGVCPDHRHDAEYEDQGKGFLPSDLLPAGDHRQRTYPGYADGRGRGQHLRH